MLFNVKQTETNRFTRLEISLADPQPDGEQDEDDLWAVLGGGKTPPTPWEAFVERLAKPGLSAFLSSGLPNTIDRALGGGFVPGTLTYYASKRAAGKSVLIRQTLACNAALGVEVAYLILEGGLDAQRCRMLASHLSERLTVIRDHYYHKAMPTEEQIEKYRRAAAEMQAQPFALMNHLLDVAMIETYLAAHPTLKMLGVDQLQHLNPPKGMKRGMEATEANSSALRQLATKYNIVILAASQINRPEGKAREQIYEPNEWSLRGSEQLGHDADNIFLLSRVKGGRVMKVVFDKTRDGDDACPPALLRFQGGFSRITEDDPDELTDIYEQEMKAERAKRGIKGPRREAETTLPSTATTNTTPAPAVEEEVPF
jgi:hypothetical protein